MRIITLYIRRTITSFPQISINWKMLEKSNVNMVDEMTTMMSSQRALQSAAQMLRMYDTVMAKASSDVGRI